MENDYRKIGRNTVAIFLSQVFIKIISFIYMVFLARHLGEEGLGQLTFASAFVEVVGIFSDFGITTVTVREVSRNRKLSNKFLVNVLALRFLISLSVFLIIVTVAHLSAFRREVLIAIILYGLANVALSLSFTYQSVLNAFEKMYYGSIISIAVTALISITGFAFIHLGYGVVWFASLQLMWSIPTGLAFIICGKRESLRFSFDIDFQLWKSLIYAAVPIGFGVAMYVVYNRIDLIMLKYMKPDYDVGIYSVAYRMMGYFNFLILALMGASAPAFSKYFGGDRARLKELAERSVRYLIFAGIPIAAGGSLLAGPIMHFLYKGRFNEAAGVFSLLALSTAIVFFGSTFGTMLLNSDSRAGKFYAQVATAGVVLNVMLNFALIPRFSYYGAAAATVATDLFATLLAFSYVLRKIARIDVLRPILKACAAACVMAIAIMLAKQKVWLPVTVALGAAVYFISAIVLRFFNSEDSRIVKDLFLTAEQVERRTD